MQLFADWYPRTRDRALYKVQYTFDAKDTLVSAGKLVESSEANGRKIATYVFDYPIREPAFNLGRFVSTKKKDVGVNFESLAIKGRPAIMKIVDEVLSRGVQGREGSAEALDPTSQITTFRPVAQSTALAPKLTSENTLADVMNSTKIMSTLLGPLPDDALTSSTHTQFGLGVAYPGLVLIPFTASLDTPVLNALELNQLIIFLNSVTAHEVAHQWWGIGVQPSSYRDSWIAEGFSEFYAGLSTQMVLGWDEYDTFWRRRQTQLLEEAIGARRASYAPLSLGFRLSNLPARFSYPSLVYSKGGFVIHMLRMWMFDSRAENPDGAFNAMMKDFYQTYKGKLASTDDFQKMVEKHMLPSMDATGDGSMQWFFDQWIHGTEIPTYVTDIKIKPAAGGKYTLSGTVAQEGVSDDFITAPPLYIDLGKGKMAMMGRVRFKGNMSQNIETTIPLPSRPKRILLNAHYDVLSIDKSSTGAESGKKKSRAKRKKKKNN